MPTLIKKQAFEYVLISMTFTEILEVKSSELLVCIYSNLFEGSEVITVIENLNKKFTLLLFTLHNSYFIR